MSHTPEQEASLEELERVAVEAAKAAGEVALSGFRGELQVRLKGYKDIVTQFDTAAEEGAMKIIKSYFPSHGFLAEESGASHAVGGEQPAYLWAIDPIDGTHNYAMQLPFWCCSVGVVDTAADTVVAAAVYDPVHGELFTARVGGGAYLNGERIRVGTSARIEDGAFAFDLGHDPEVAARMLDLTRRMYDESRRVRLLGSAVLALAYVAAGRLDGFYHLGLQPWDLAAASLLIREAGGLITDWQGKPVGPRRSSAAATNPALHPQLLSILKAYYMPA